MLLSVIRNGTTLLSADMIHDVSDSASASSVIEDSVDGTPISVTLEASGQKRVWTVQAAYLSREQTRALTDAYTNRTPLKWICDGNTFNVVIADYPKIARLPSLDGVVYTVSATLQAGEQLLGAPPIITSNGPRLFGR